MSSCLFNMSGTINTLTYFKTKKTDLDHKKKNKYCERKRLSCIMGYAGLGMIRLRQFNKVFLPCANLTEGFYCPSKVIDVEYF